MSIRVRTHANPLRRFPDLAPPDWPAPFRDPARRFAVEFGCAKGEFLVAHARALPEWNILGTEVRRAVAFEAMRAIAREGLLNAVACWGNIAGRLAQFAPCGRIDAAYAFFPDPWFKKRHAKRRLFQDALVRELASLMPPGAFLHALTDHAPLGAWMREVVARCRDFEECPAPVLVARSAWEEHCLRTARPYERLAWVRV